MDQETNRGTKIRDFLSEHCPLVIAAEAVLSLESPLYSDELSMTLKQMKPGKSPGPDGFTTKYYKPFSAQLLTHFLLAINSVSACSQHSPQLLEAHVMVLPKRNKDPSLVSNYRPISLLNVDIKWFAKAMANGLLPILPDVISPGFFLSIDTEKTFDSLGLYF